MSRSAVWHIDVGSSERDLQANAGASVCDTEPSFSSEEYMSLKQCPNMLHHSVCDCCLKSPYLFPVSPLESFYRTSPPLFKELLKPSGSHHTSAVFSLQLHTFKHTVRMRLCVDCSGSLCVTQVVIISISLRYRQVFFLSFWDIANYRPLECSCMFFVSPVMLIDSQWRKCPTEWQNRSLTLICNLVLMAAVLLLLASAPMINGHVCSFVFPLSCGVSSDHLFTRLQSHCHHLFKM